MLSAGAILFLVSCSCGASWIGGQGQQQLEADTTSISLAETENTSLPSVSMVASIYGDYRGLGPNLVRNMMRSTYEGDIELIVLSLSEMSDEYLSKFKLGSDAEYLGKYKREFRYIHSPAPTKQIREGANRNCLSLMARNDVLINIDADDIYMPDYVGVMVRELTRTDIQNVLVEVCAKHIPTSKIYPTGSIKRSDIYLQIQQDDLSSSEIQKIRERDYDGECFASDMGFAMAVPRFLVSKGEGLKMGLPGNSDPLPRFLRRPNVGEPDQNPWVSCFKDYNNFTLLTHSRYGEIKAGEEGDMEWFTYSTGQGVPIEPLDPFSETLERCKRSMFGKVKNYCEALEEKYNAVQQQNLTGYIPDYAKKVLVNPGIGAVSMIKKDGLPLLIKTDTALSLTHRILLNQHHHKTIKQTRKLFLRYLDLVHYFAARSSSDSDGVVTFYPVEGPHYAGGNAKIMEGLKSYWCDTLDDNSKDYVVQLLNGWSTVGLDEKTVKLNHQRTEKKRASITKYFCG